MDDTLIQSVNNAIASLRHGGIIAYPTEAVYGLGCDPFNRQAIERLLKIKNRSPKKGFILIASEWKHVQRLVEPIDPKALARVFATWPGPVTWVFPASPEVPAWVRGEHTTVAVRITAHPIAKALCQRYARPIVSTSANTEGQPPMRDERMIRMVFGNTIDAIVAGSVGPSHRPSEIRDAITGEVLRAR